MFENLYGAKRADEKPPPKMKEISEPRYGGKRIKRDGDSFAIYNPRIRDVRLAPDSGARADIPGPPLWARNGNAALESKK
jgi:hypothetical protein